MMRAPVLFGAVVLAVSFASGAAAQSTSPLGTSPFESFVELLRQQAGIPGISAAIVHNGEIVWERGFGFQNVEARIRATPDTPYPIAGLTQTLAATLVLECVEQRGVYLDDPASEYGVSLPEAAATVRQILNHTSAAPPGAIFQFDPDRFGQLSRVIETCIPQPYRKTVAVNLLERFAMKDSVPGRDVQEDSIAEQTETLFAESVRLRYKGVLDRMAVPYRVDKKGRASRSDIPVESMTGATGVVSTVRDLARFDAALDSDILLREETLTAAWTNAVGRDRMLPTGLGWFVQKYNAETIVWQFGVMTGGYSSLILKIPSKKLTLILLANSDGLCSPFNLSTGDVTKSLFALLFLRLFV
jgi:CubicO group peptidase (beta-lactamase class C family)